MIALDLAALDAWCQGEAVAVRERLTRLGAGFALLAGGMSPRGDPPAAPAPCDAAALPASPGAAEGPLPVRPATSWAILAGDDRRRWVVFGERFSEACVAALVRAGLELSREGLAQVLATEIGLPHWQDDDGWGKAGFEALKSKISSEMTRLVTRGRVTVRPVATGRRGESRLMWRVADLSSERGSAATGLGTGTGAGPGGCALPRSREGPRLTTQRYLTSNSFLLPHEGGPPSCGRAHPQGSCPGAVAPGDVKDTGFPRGAVRRCNTPAHSPTLRWTSERNSEPRRT